MSAQGCRPDRGGVHVCLYRPRNALPSTAPGTLFGCVAPLTLPLVSFLLALLLPLWAHNLSHVQRPWPQGLGFDSGGVAWPHVVQKQMYVLLLAQFVLAAIQAHHVMHYVMHYVMHHLKH